MTWLTTSIGEVRAALEAAMRLPSEVRAQIESASTVGSEYSGLPTGGNGGAGDALALGMTSTSSPAIGEQQMGGQARSASHPATGWYDGSSPARVPAGVNGTINPG